MIPPKSTFLSVFNHRFYQSNWSDPDMLGHERVWTVSIPNEDSGPCYTYDPPAPSIAQRYFGVEIKPNLSSESDNWDKDMELFLHERGKFFYFKEEAPPNNIRIHVNTLRNINHTTILGSIL